MSDPLFRDPGADLSHYQVKGEIPAATLINWLTAGAVVFIIFFAIRALGRGDTLYVIALSVAGIALAANALCYLAIRHEVLHRRWFILAITGLFVFLAVKPIEDNASILWLFAYPPIIFYIADSRIGVLACSGGAIALAALFSPIGDALFDTPYSVSFRLVFLMVFTFEAISCYVLDQSRQRNKHSLLRLAREFEYAAKHDALTGLANRREGRVRLEAEHQRYLRSGRPYAVILMDIDLFKNVNDTYGHQAGDQVIVLVADTLRDVSRKVDIIARWGGEEFLVLLPETSSQQACKTANRIRQAIAEASIQFEDKPFNVTISAGVAMVHQGESIDQLLFRVDEALYAAKGSGRNTICDCERSNRPYRGSRDD